MHLTVEYALNGSFYIKVQVFMKLKDIMIMRMRNFILNLIYAKERNNG